LSEITVGVLALQGAFREHISALEKCGVNAIEIRFPEQLDGIDGLVIPGGESTTIFKLVEKYNFKNALDKFYRQKKPIFGTCAGLILLAKKVLNNNLVGLGYIDIIVDRNAYGRQVDSFEQFVDLTLSCEQNLNGKKFKAVFIRAPKIKEKGSNVKELCNLDGVTVFAQQENIIVCAFHPELTDDLRIHKYFVNIVKKSK
jgi:5'-phosphate synthase pdxT subunit